MNKAIDVVKALAAADQKIAVAESCTGGLLAAALTSEPGSSVVFDRGFVTYSNAAKTEMLGVSAELIAREGAVSQAVALAMAYGALKNSNASVAASLTGIAGPGGGSDAKPVGLVQFAVVTETKQLSHVAHFAGLDRDAVRAAAVAKAFELILKIA
jgi:nicotinamide-nucleotide amidase